MTTIVGGICPRCGQFHDLLLAVDGSIVCRNADGTAERMRQLEAERDAARAERDAARAEVRALLHIRGLLEAEIAALRESGEAIARGMVAQARREVLADLKVAVEGLRERGDAHADDCPGRPGMRGICACDPP